MFWFAVLTVMVRIGVFMPYLRACDRLMYLATMEAEA